MSQDDQRIRGIDITISINIPAVGGAELGYFDAHIAGQDDQRIRGIHRLVPIDIPQQGGLFNIKGRRDGLGRIQAHLACARAAAVAGPAGKKPIRCQE